MKSSSGAAPWMPVDACLLENDNLWMKSAHGAAGVLVTQDACLLENDKDG